MATLASLRERWQVEAARRAIDLREVDLLLADALERPLSWILAHDDEAADERVEAALAAAMRRRFGREPLQYVRGRTEFYGRVFVVDARVLIPRPETEILVEQAIRRIAGGRTIVDVGTGSGCIAISLAIERADLHVVATDMSLGALALARRNAERLDARVRFAASDVLAAIGRARLGAIVSNPPYIPARDLPTLQPEVRDYEPEIALTPGETGLETIGRIYQEGAAHLDRDGLILLEIGYGQGDAVRALGARYGWTVELRDDLAGIPRVAISSRA
ncbi:MAG: peptide chain release factor N(5)-glutamine methyltransferase [Thermoanaerobaculia bacterium]